jgi:hypothetical protein
VNSSARCSMGRSQSHGWASRACHSTFKERDVFRSRKRSLATPPRGATLRSLMTRFRNLRRFQFPRHLRRVPPTNGRFLSIRVKGATFIFRLTWSVADPAAWSSATRGHPAITEYRGAPDLPLTGPSAPEYFEGVAEVQGRS